MTLRDRVENRPPTDFVKYIYNMKDHVVLHSLQYFASIFQNISTLTIYILFNDREIAYITNNTQVLMIVCDKQMLPKFIELYSQCASLRHILYMHPIIDR